MLQEDETKQEGMFTKHKKLVLDLISGHQDILTNHATVLLR